jgi:aspartate aminotransferase-like enzyme
MLNEGLNNIFARHARVAQIARDGVNSLGLTLFPDEKFASNTVTAVNADDRIDVPKLIRVLREDYGVVFAGGQQKLSGKIFRIGHLGSVEDNDIKSVLEALNEALPRAKKG